MQRSELHPLDRTEAGDEPVSLSHGCNCDWLAVQINFERCPQWRLRTGYVAHCPFVQRAGSKSISNELELAFQERACSMTKPDILSRKVVELKEWQRVAWRRVSDPSVTNFERREIRNHIKESDEELRYYLGMVSDRLRR